jgi:hypothetical protein
LLSESATTNYLGTSATQSFTILPTSQPSLTITSNDNPIFGSTVTLSAVGGNGTGGLSFSVDQGAPNTAGCLITAGTTLSSTAVGRCTIIATKAATSAFAIQSVSQVITVSPANQSPLYVSSQNQTIPSGGAPPLPSTTFNASASTITLVAYGGASTNGVPVGAVTFAVDTNIPNSAGCSVVGSILTYVSAGTCAVIATMAGNGNYLATTSNSTVVAIGRSTGFISVTASGGTSPTTVTFSRSTPSTTLIATGATGQIVPSALSFQVLTSSATISSASYSNAAFTFLGTGLTQLFAVGETVTTSGFANVGFNLESAVVASVTDGAVVLSAPAAGTPSPSTAGTGTMSVINSAGCSISGTTLSYSSSGWCVVMATQGEPSPLNSYSYFAANSPPVTIQITPAQPMVVGVTNEISTPISSTADLVYLYGNFPDPAPDPSTLTYQVVSGANCSLQGTTLTFLAGGSCSITATAAGYEDTSNDSVPTQSSTTDLVVLDLTGTTASASSNFNPLSPAVILAAVNGPGSGAPTYSIVSPGVLGCAIDPTNPNVVGYSGTLPANTTPNQIFTCTIAASEPGGSTTTLTLSIQAPNGQFAVTVTTTPFGSASSPTNSIPLSTSGAPTGAVVVFAVTSPGSAGCSLDANQSSVDYTSVGTCQVAAVATLPSGVVVASAPTTLTVGPGVPSAPVVVGTSGTYTPGSMTLCLSGTSPCTAPVGVTYSVVTTTPNLAHCSITGAVLTYTTAGSCSVVADLAASGNYGAAHSILTAVTINQATQTPSLSATSVVANSASPFLSLSPSASAPDLSTGAISYSISQSGGNTAGCVLSSRTILTYSARPTSGSVSCSVLVTWSGDNNYQSASVEISITILAPPPLTITSTQTTYGAGGSNSTALAASGGNGAGAITWSLVAVGTAGCSVNGSTLTYATAGTCVIAADKAGNVGTATATVTILPAAQASVSITFTNTTSTSAVVNVSGGSGSGIWTVSAVATGASSVGPGGAANQCQLVNTSPSTWLLTFGIGNGTCQVTATKAADASYRSASTSSGIASTITLIPQWVPLTITSTVATQGNLGTLALSTTGGTASGPVTFTVLTSSAAITSASFSNGTFTYNGAHLSAYFVGEAVSFSGFATAGYNLTGVVSAVTPTSVSVANPSSTAPSSSSAGAGQVAPSNSAGCTSSGATLSFGTAGVCVIQATQGGQVARATVTIQPSAAPTFLLTSTLTTFSALTPTVQLTVTGAPSGAVVYAISTTMANTAGCSLAGVTLTYGTVGTCGVVATVGNSSITGIVVVGPNTTPLQVASGGLSTTFGSTTNNAVLLSTVGGNASATGPISYVVVAAGTAGCSIANGILTYTGDGSCQIAVSQGADATYLAATGPTQTFTVQSSGSALAITTTQLTYLAVGNGSSPQVLGVDGVPLGAGALTFVVSASGSAGCSITPSGLLAYGSTGTCSVYATIQANGAVSAQTSPTVTITIAPSAQAGITIVTTSTPYTSALTVQLSTTGGSGNGAVSYQVIDAGTAGCSITGNQLSYVGVGICSLTATQAASGNYQEQTSNTTIFTITQGIQAPLTITSSALAYNQALSQSLTVSSNGPSGTITTFAVISAGTSGCAIVNSALTFTSTGTCTVQATNSGNANYGAQRSAVTTITITAGTQAALSITTASTQTFASSPSNQVALTASGGAGTGAIRYSVTSAGTAGCVITGTTLTFTSTGTCVITATSPASSNWQMATARLTLTVVASAQASLAITPTATNFTSSKSLSLSTTGGSGSGAVTWTLVSAGSAGCSISQNTLSYVAVGTCQVSATKASSTNYLAASTGTITVTINAAVFSIASTATTYDPTSGSLSLSTNGGQGSGAVSYVVATTGSAGCTIVGSTLSYASAGTCVVVATKAAQGSSPVQTTSATVVTIAKATQSPLTFTSSPTPSFMPSPGNTLVLATAGGSNTGPITYSLVAAGSAGCTIIGSTLTFQLAGTCTVTATSRGNGNYRVATSSQVVTVTPPPQTGMSFQTLVTLVQGGTVPVSFNVGGGITVALQGLTCANSCTTLNFTGGSLNLFGIYRISVDSGAITTSGFAFSGARLTLPASWPGGALSSVTATNLALTYSGGPSNSMVQASGTFQLPSSSDFLGLPLPSGWQMATTITLTGYLGQTAGMTLTSFLYSSAGGVPTNCTGNGATCLQIIGSASKVGTFSVALSGSLQLGPTAVISNIQANWQTGSPFTGAGTLAIGGDWLTVSLSYSDTANWSLMANGAFKFFGVSTTATGTVTDTSGTTSGSFSMAVVASLSGGLTASLSATWNTSAGVTATGTLNFNSGIGTLRASVTYVSSTKYSFSIATQNSTLVLIPGVISLGTISGSYCVDSTNPSCGPVNLAAQVTLFSTTAQVTITYTNSSTWSISVAPAGQPTGSFVIVPGASLGATTLTAGQQTCSGLPIGASTLCMTSSIAFSGFGTLNLIGTYTNSANWSFTATAASTTTFTLIPGVTLSLSQFSGGLAQTRGTFSWNLTAQLANSVTLYSNASGASLTVQNLRLSFSSACPTLGGAPICPAGTNADILSMSGTVTINLGSGLGSSSVALVAAYGVTTGNFVLQAALPTITIVPGLLSISSPSITVAYSAANTTNTVNTGAVTFASGQNIGNEGGYTVSVGGAINLSLPGAGNVTLPTTFTYANGGFVIAASLAGGGSFGSLGSSGSSLTTLAYSSTPMNMTFTVPGTPAITQYLNAPGVVFGGSLSLPSWLQTFLGTSSIAPVGLFATYSSSTHWSVNAIFPLSIPISTGTPDFAFSFSNFALTLEQNGTAFLQSISVAGTMTLSGPVVGGGSSTIAVVLGLQYLDAPPQITGFISANGVGGPIWSNVFGIPGLDINQFNIAVGISLVPPIPLPDLGFEAQATIDTSATPLWNAIGLVGTPTITVAMNLSEANPCMGVAISGQNGQNVIDIAGGALTASQASLYLAPNGCQIGTYSIPQGFTMDFTGALFGVSVQVQAGLYTTPTFGFAASLQIGSFNLANIISMQQLDVEVAFNHELLNPNGACTGSSSVFILCFSGGINVLGEQATLAGEVTETSFALTGTLSGFSGLGSQFSMGPLYLSTSGSIAGASPSFSLNASGSLSVAGTNVAIAIGFAFANYQITTMTFQASVNSCAWSLNLAVIKFQACFGGTFDFNLSTSQGQFFMSASLSASISAAFYGPSCGNPFKSCFYNWTWTGWSTLLSINVYVNTNGQASASFSVCGYSESFSIDVGQLF